MRRMGDVTLFNTLHNFFYNLQDTAESYHLRHFRRIVTAIPPQKIVNANISEEARANMIGKNITVNLLK